MRQRNVLSFVVALLLAVTTLLTACGKPQETVVFERLDDLEGRTVGQVLGSVFNDFVDKRIDNVTYKAYNDSSAVVAALERGDIDAAAFDMPPAELLTSMHPQFVIFPELVANDSYGFILQKNSPYTAEFTAAIEAFSADGTLETLKEKWFSGDESRMKIDWSQYRLEGRANGTLRYAFDNTLMPMNYAINGDEHAGFEVELLLKIADRLDMNVTLSPMMFASLIPSLETDKIDVASGCVSITEERKKAVDFPVTHYVGGVVLLCRAENVAGATVTNEPGFFEKLCDSFVKTFITEQRWKLVLDGLLTTLAITLLAGILGTAVGFVLCLMRRSRYKAVAALATGMCKLVLGIPNLVLLMIMYFIVFAASGAGPVLVSILTFALMFGVAVAGLLSTGIEAIDKGQWEAAAALGFTKTGAFVRIVLPPAIRHVLPLYKSELVSMLKLTSIVGYISAVDLTRAGDLIRSRTYEAFFPLIATAILYFIVSMLIVWLMGKVEIGIDPAHRPAKLPRGVVETPIRDILLDKKGDEAPELIRISHLQKIYPSGAMPFKDVNTSIKKGEVITVIGPSGTGKSTLLRCINGLEEATAGEIAVFGENVCDKKTNLPQLRRRLGMVFQSFNLFDGKTVLENVMLAPVVLKGKSKQEAYETAMQLLKAVGMAERALQFPDQLSGGQKQRVAIARTLAMEPDIVLLDEPTSALDPTMVGEVLTVIRQLAAAGYTMLIVTHEMKFARDVSTRIFYMDQGEIYEDGTPAQVFDNPRRNRTRAFVNRLKVLHFKLESAQYDFIAMSEALQHFGEKHLLARRRIESLRRVFEEMCATGVVPAEKGEHALHVLTEYAEETDTLTMRFLREGERFDPLEEGDELAVKLIMSCITDREFVYENGENRLCLTL